MNNPSRKNFANYASLAIGMALLGGGMPPLPDLHKNDNSNKPDIRKCALPGCTNESSRGYCCAAHCKIHKQMLKERKVV